MIHNADMDEMDLKRALDRVRAEFKSDTESLAQSDALSGATLSSENFNGQVHDCGSYRKASDIGLFLFTYSFYSETLAIVLLCEFTLSSNQFNSFFFFLKSVQENHQNL